MKWAHALALLPVAMPAAAQAPGSPDARARATLAQMSLNEKLSLVHDIIAISLGPRVTIQPDTRHPGSAPDNADAFGQVSLALVMTHQSFLSFKLCHAIAAIIARAYCAGHFMNSGQPLL